MNNNRKLHKVSSAAIFVNTIQGISIIAFLAYMLIGNSPNRKDVEIIETVIFLFIILLSIGINFYLTFRYINSIHDFNSNNLALKERSVQLEALNTTLRSQRHDFMNHLQVVYSLMEMKEYQESMDYIEKIYCDIQRVNRALKTSIPAVNALIQAKLISAEKCGITVRLNITTTLDKLAIPAWEFCRVISNLIDNALHALQTVDEREHRELCIEIFEDLKSFGFRIRNNGPAIQENVLPRIFDSGFTTKKDKGEGMGLAITKEIMEQYDSEIYVISNQVFTEFTGTIPKKLEQQ